MKNFKEIFIHAGESFQVSAIVNDQTYKAGTIADLLKIVPLEDDVTVEQLIDVAKLAFVGDDSLPFEFHGVRLTDIGSSMLFLTLSGKVILLREAVPYGDEPVSEFDPQRYSYQIFDKNQYSNTFDWFLRDATSSVAEYINLCRQLGISYVRNLD